MRIVDYEVRPLAVPCEPPISDSQYEFDTAGVAVLELEADTGEVGVGLGGVSASLPAGAVRERVADVAEDLCGDSPFHHKARTRRPRGGAYGDPNYGGRHGAVDVALWDLCGKHLGLPLYELLGGTDPAVPAYASGLHFSLDDAVTRERYEAYADAGFDAAKVKVGYPALGEDLERIDLVRDAMGDPEIMVDANEAWSPKEAIRRVRAYRDAGVDLRWVEDPILRDDVDGYRRVVEALPDTHVNTGEYVNLEGKRRLLERGAVDVLHLSGGYVSTALEAARLGAAFGVPVALHDTVAHLCVHLAAALPELALMEYWPRPWERLVEDGVAVEDGTLIAPDRPGHGIVLDEDALEAYAR
ncbi:MAG: mandelate racemase/muconate lactonizing enzyme family protein [Halobacteriales archaeon]